MFKKIVLFLFVLIFFLILACVGLFYWLVVLHPGEEISRENIQSILGRESPVFYSDGKTRLGVFFDEAHRQYVTWNQLPSDFVNALVASEDNRFFEHFGFDAVSIGRAAIKNYEAGRVVQGGSTLTQQTAKNLFKRSGRSYEAKLKELLAALRLEYHYSKEQIFEFYANQFYVRGNGHGLGIAARYYFDKKVEDLSLLECVFIAGSVKRPNYYNPFNRRTEADREKVRQRIKVRMDYVLGQMKQQGMLSAIQYAQAINSDVIFMEGKVGYPLDYVMEMVRDAVGSEAVQAALEEHGIGNLATAGLRVITSVDKELQEEALYVLRRELSRLDVRLRGYEHDEIQKELAAVNYRGDKVVKKMAFLFGNITKIEQGEAQVIEGIKIAVNFGGGLGNGVIDAEGLNRQVKALVKWEQTRWSEMESSDFPTLLKQLQVGDRVWVSVRDIDDDGRVFLDLERFPKLQGGALVIQKGMIKALAGGVENRFFNRAIAARRTMGSAFKPFVFAAALQLGWNTTDMLNNSREVFIFQGQPYYPRPDHNSPYNQVSMSWAGVHSENLASIWLVEHLCDRLSFDDFKEVTGQMGLLPRVRNGVKEPYNLYRTRIRDTYGIVLNRSVLQEVAYNLAVKNIEIDFLFENLKKEYAVLKKLHYGLNFDQYQEDIDHLLTEKDLKEYEQKELLLRKRLLKTNYLSLVLRQQQLGNFRQYMKNRAENLDPFANLLPPIKGALYFDRQQEQFSFVGIESQTDDMVLVDLDGLAAQLSSQNLDEQAEFWGDVLLDAEISSAALTLVENQVEREFQHLLTLSPYSIEVLAGVKDFRLLVGLLYLVELGHELGISSQLDPVLSFPLGSNVVTLLETVRMYEGLITGDVFLAGEEGTGNQDLMSVLDRIETDDGEVVYRTKLRRKTLVSSKVRMVLDHVLENVVTFGTGRYAKSHARLPLEKSEGKDTLAALDLVIPLLGKTGTANNYTNASFFGYLPGPSKGGTGMVIDGGYSIGVYVGFDDNKKMRRNTTHITGSSGALPTWTDLVNTILREKGYAQRLDLVDISFYGLNLLHDELGQINLAVDKNSGGRITRPVEDVNQKNRLRPTTLTFGTLSESGNFEPERLFAPFWGGGDHLLESDL
jgi:penicillin-binding protein 1A